MIARTLLIIASLFLGASISGQEGTTYPVPADLLPRGAHVIETANVPLRDHSKRRVLVLWMSSPQRVMSHWDGAADFLYGDHWYGLTFLSLVDPSTSRLINTVPVHPGSEEDQKNFELPFFTLSGFYYVPHPDKEHKGRPLLLHLRDLTGESVAGQFVLFDHVASGIAAGSVFGYSPRSDTAVQYSVELTQNKFGPDIQVWAVSLFDQKPLRAGYWKFTTELGHGSFEWIDAEAHFDQARQLFVEKLATRPYPGFSQFHCELNAKSLPEFLGRIRSVVADESKIQWLQDLIGKTPRNAIGSAGMVPTVNGAQQMLDVEFQTSSRGAIGIDLRTDDDEALGAALLPKLSSSCARY